jgi:hypothetical protein
MNDSLMRQWEIEPFADVQGVRSLGNEPGTESPEKQKHLFAHTVHKQQFGEIEDELDPMVVGFYDERSNVLRTLSCEPAFQPEDNYSA